MKRIISIVLIVVVAFSSCKKEENTNAINFSEFRSKVINDIIERETYGLNYQIEVLSEQLFNMPEDTLVPVYESKSHSYNGLYGVFFYEITSNLLPLVNGPLEYVSQANGRYETNYMKSDDQINNSWLVHKYSENSDFIVLEGSSSRYGTQYLKFYDENISTKLSLSFSEIEVNRITSLIKKGNIEFIFEATDVNGNPHQNSGTIIFSDYYYKIALD